MFAFFIAMPTRKTIKSHKGGRTAVLPARLTPATLAELQRQCAADGITVGDWLERAVWARATRPAEIDVYAASAFGLDSDDVDGIERDCARRGIVPRTMDDWRVLFEMFRAGRDAFNR